MKKSIVAGLVLLASSAFAQNVQTQQPLSFDVASVRPSRPGSAQHTNVPLDSGNVYAALSPGAARTAAAGLLIATHQPLWRYISFAYHLSGTQELSLRFNFFSGVPKSGAPTWVTGTFTSPADFFDIEARTTPGASIDQMRLMMQSLLADRFRLVVHHTTAEAPVFALILAKPGITGPDIKPHPASDSCARPQPDASGPKPSAVSPSSVGDLPPICGVIAHVPSSQAGYHFGGRGIPISLLATSLPTMTGLAAIPRPVVDRTGLTGLYDFALHWIPDTATSEQSAPSGPQSSPFHDALKRQLGLELKSSHAPIDFLIVDHVEHPSAN